MRLDAVCSSSTPWARYGTKLDSRAMHSAAGYSSVESFDRHGRRAKLWIRVTTSRDRTDERETSPFRVTTACSESALTMCRTTVVHGNAAERERTTKKKKKKCLHLSLSSTRCAWRSVVNDTNEAVAHRVPSNEQPTSLEDLAQRRATHRTRTEATLIIHGRRAFASSRANGTRQDVLRTSQ